MIQLILGALPEWSRLPIDRCEESYAANVLWQSPT